MELKKLLKSIEILESYNDADIDINQIAYNSQKVTCGDLFVCIKGYKTDGHIFIGDAVKNGALATIVEDYQPQWDIPQYVVANSRKALSALADTYYNHISNDFIIIGITGTNGKTTIAFMVNDILEKQGFKTGLIGTVMVKYDGFLKHSLLTTPESLDFHNHLFEMKKKNITHVCTEVSSSALEQNRVGNIDFDIVSLHNISHDHIDLHGSFENYFDAKASLIRNAKPHQYAILNLDDEYSASLINQTHAKVITFGIEHKTGDIWCNNIDISTGRAKFSVEIMKSFQVEDKLYDKADFDIELKIPGYHSISNAMVAIIVGLLCKVPVETIQKSLKTFYGVERRFEIIFDEDFMIVDDYFANIENIISTLKTIEDLKYRNLKLIYALRGSRGITVISEIAETMVLGAKKLGLKEIVACLSKSRVKQKDIVMPEELEAFMKIMKSAGISVRVYEELEDAIAVGLSEVEKGDILLLAGTQGMDYGAKIVLGQIHEKRPDIDDDALFAPLKNRVAGIA